MTGAEQHTHSAFSTSTWEGGQKRVGIGATRASTWDGRVNIRRRVEKGWRRVNMRRCVNMGRPC